MLIDNGLIDWLVNKYFFGAEFSRLFQVSNIINDTKISIYSEIVCLSEDMKNKCNETLTFKWNALII
jgi:hypothetical protein